LLDNCISVRNNNFLFSRDQYNETVIR
jgi:hypothetical protein